MTVRQFWKNVRERAKRACDGPSFWAISVVRSLWPFSANAGTPAYIAFAVSVAFFWYLGNARIWPHTWHHALLAGIVRNISAETVVTVAVGLTAIPLALSIMLGQMYKGYAGRLRVLLKASQVQLSLIATITTAVVATAVGGRFSGWPALIYLSFIAGLSCSSIFRVLNLLQHPGQFVEQWGRFILSRQQRITLRSVFRQRKADAAAATFAEWGKDIKIDQWFEHFHREGLDKYVKVPAGRRGQVDDVDRAAIRQQLAILQTYADSQTGQSASIPTDAHTTDSSSIGMLEDRVKYPLLVITHLPESLVDDPDEAILLFRKDILRSPWVCGNIARSLRRAFRIDNSEHILEMVADLRSEATELRDELMRGIRSNNQVMVTDFRSVGQHVIGAARGVMELQPSTAARRVYSDVLEVLVHSVNDARHLVENSSETLDEEVKSLTLSLPRSLAYTAAETGSPDAFERCLSPLFSQCREALQQQPNAPDTEDCLSWYGVLSLAIQRTTEPNTERKMGIDDAVSEARLLLENLSTLLLSFARQQKWDAANLVAKEISSLEPRSSRRHNLAVTSAEYSDRFGALMYLLCFGAHACLVDLAIAEPPIPVRAGLIEATWPYYDTDLPGLLNVYVQATAEGTADAWNWGWEPPGPPLKAYFIRTDEVLAWGFVAIALTWPELALFQDSDTWLATQSEKLEQAAGGPRELEHLLGAGSLVDKMLKDDDKIAKLAGVIGQHRYAVDRSVDALRRLLKYVQDMIESNKRAGIRKATVSQNVITGFTTSLLKQYEANAEKEVHTLEDLDLLSTGPAPADIDGGPRVRGVNTVIDKQWFMAEESDSWTSIAGEYGNGLHKMQVGFAIMRFSEIGTATDLASILAPDSPLQASSSVLLVDTDVEWLPAELQALVEDSASPKSDHSAPDAYLRVAGQRLPVYRVWVGGAMKPVMLIIQRSNSAHVIRVPWSSENGWTLSPDMEIKVRLRVPSQDLAAMNELLAQNPAWLEEKGDEKVAYLEELVWLEAYQQLAFDPGATPGVLRLDLPTDEPEAPPQTKDKATG